MDQVPSMGARCCASEWHVDEFSQLMKLEAAPF
jgi:hypothetical protein